MRLHLCLLPLGLVACAPPLLEEALPLTLFDGGDGLSTVEERVLRGEILEDLTLTAGDPWILDGTVFVGNDSTSVQLDIEPGAVIYGNPATRGTLVVTRGSRIVADGTSGQPIVFTSPRARGARNPGDWGGLVINGRAPVNGCGGSSCEIDGEANTGLYGGTDPNDDSGVLRYVRIEFGGALYDTENELNSLTLQGVGKGTVVDMVQVHQGADDGVEIFGGTVDLTHIVSTGSGDDSMDWTNGWTGRAQFVVIQQHEPTGDRGFEADNNADDYNSTPRSQPMLANLTVIGHPSSGTAINLRRGTGAIVANSILTGFDTCVDIDDPETWDNGYDGATPNGSLAVSGTWLDCDAIGSSSTWNTKTVDDVLLADNPGNVVDDPLIVSPFDVDAPDFTLSASSAALTGAIPMSDGFFEDVAFAGAVGTQDWTSGWTQTGID